MAKEKTRFECSSCGHSEPKWLGKCPGCGSWNSFIELKPAKGSSTRAAQGGRKDKAGNNSSKPQKLSGISTDEGTRYRPVNPKSTAFSAAVSCAGHRCSWGVNLG